METTYRSSGTISFHGIKFRYSAIWNKTRDERLTFIFPLTSTTGKIIEVQWEGAAGINLCRTADGNIVYAFLKNATYQYDLNEHTMTAVQSGQITPKLEYLGRFEIAEIRDESHVGKVAFVDAKTRAADSAIVCKVP
jgi:hypothetical protein